MGRVFKKNALILCLCVEIVWIASCSNNPIMETTATASIQPTNTRIIPTFIHHSPPDLEIPTDWIEQGGCPISENQLFMCEENSEIKKLGCDEIAIDNLLGGLPDPVVRCISFAERPPDWLDLLGAAV